MRSRGLPNGWRNISCSRYKAPLVPADVTLQQYQNPHSRKLTTLQKDRFDMSDNELPNLQALTLVEDSSAEGDGAAHTAPTRVDPTRSCAGDGDDLPDLQPLTLADDHPAEMEGATHAELTRVASRPSSPEHQAIEQTDDDAWDAGSETSETTLVDPSDSGDETETEDGTEAEDAAELQQVGPDGMPDARF